MPSVRLARWAPLASLARVAFSGAVAFASVLVTPLAWADPQAAALGRKLFEGAMPMSASIVGQGVALPPKASRCANCHLREAPAAAAAASGPRVQRYGPVLNAGQLLEPARRRGGPASRYDNSAFCRLLRTGIDPASVIIDRTMPRFEIASTECDALWVYLTESR